MSKNPSSPRVLSPAAQERQDELEYQDGFARGLWWVHSSGAVEADRGTMNNICAFLDRMQYDEFGKDPCVACAFTQAVADTSCPNAEDRRDVEWMLGRDHHVTPEFIFGFADAVTDVLIEVEAP